MQLRETRVLRKVIAPKITWIRTQRVLWKVWRTSWTAFHFVLLESTQKVGSF
jgi:hypothetical protein